MEIKTCIIVIADISGYTQFIQQYKKSLLHAEMLISELINAIIHTSKKPLTVNKLEGDAVLFVSQMDSKETTVTVDLSKNIVNQAETFFKAFKHKQNQLIASNLCDCDACINLDKLQLKIVLHIGEALFKKIQQFDEIAGTDVIIAHRLLKNSIDAHEYLLMTQNYYQHCGGWPTEKPEFSKEHIDEIGDVDIVFYRLKSAKKTPPIKKSKLKGFGNLLRLELYRMLRTLGLKQSKRFEHLPIKN
ncbi:MAG TPA: DUF2652 domain-containing protein [Gammaproteobacteria bacterium]|jgi:hypothetical protein|nr:DUF2652 domain-containing protein [Gammaproteobacteria bacterium]